jgi:hypothetical protein
MRSFRDAVWLALAAGLIVMSTAKADERSVSTASGEPVVFGRHTQWRNG